jgi:hypothetical protein
VNALPGADVPRFGFSDGVVMSTRSISGSERIAEI